MNFPFHLPSASALWDALTGGGEELGGRHSTADQNFGSVSWTGNMASVTKCPSAPSPSQDQEIPVTIKLAAAGSWAPCTLDLGSLQKTDWSLRPGLTLGDRTPRRLRAL